MPSLLSEALKQTPAHWSQMKPSEASSESQFVELCDTSTEYQNVVTLMHNTRRSCTYNYQRIHESIPRDASLRVVRVQNAYLWGCYLLKKEEYAKKRTDKNFNAERMLWHSTTGKSAEKIAQDNFDWRQWRLAEYGEGVNFSPTAEYANWYANKSNPLERVLILSRVLVSKAIPVVPERVAYMAQPSRMLPPSSYDTTRSSDRNKYVKYYDNEFYPEYLVYYTSNTKRAMQLKKE